MNSITTLLSKFPSTMRQNCEDFIMQVMAMLPISISAFSTESLSRGNAIIYIDVTALHIPEISVINELGKDLQDKTGRFSNEPPMLLIYKPDAKQVVKIDLIDQLGEWN